MESIYRQRGFLPEGDPLTAFPPDSEFTVLDELGKDLPSLSQDDGFRDAARRLTIPFWDERKTNALDQPELRLYYLRLGFLASAYINQIGQSPVTVNRIAWFYPI